MISYLSSRIRISRDLPQKKHPVRGKLSDFVETLLPDQFVSAHRSYVVNMEAVDQIAPSFLTINNTEIPIGAKYKEALKTKLTIF